MSDVDSPTNSLTHPTRRGVLAGGATLLAGFGLATAAASPATASPATAAGPTTSATPTSTGDLAVNRPVTVSSTDYAPTPGAFAVDTLCETGVKGTGWRAAQGDPQWISVDLQASCTITKVTLVFEATLSDPAFDGNYSATYGDEILSSAAVAFSLDTSVDGKTWTSVYSTTAGTGAEMDITLPQPVTARYVRMTSTKRSNTNPVGLNGFQVYGTSHGSRPAATGWTSWGTHYAPAPALRVAADGTVPVESGWTVTLDDFVDGKDGKALSAASVDTSTWLPATVPGTVLASLVEQKHFPDPVAAFNNLQIPEALSRHSWWYRRTLDLPRGLDTSAGRHVWLEFDGITQTSQVWVNGVNVGSTPNPFRRGIFDITSALAKKGPQAIAVQATPMAHPGTPGDKSDNGNTFVQGGHLYLDSPTYLAASGWDWMPAVRDRGTGIWNHVRLRSTGQIVIGDARVQTSLPNLPKTDVAEITVTVPVTNVGTSATSTTVTIAFDHVTATKTVTVPAGGSVDVVFAPAVFPALRVKNPSLWWPNGYGEPALHELVMTAAVGRAVSDRRTTSFGIRQFGYASNEPVVVPPSVSPTFVVPSGSDLPGQVVNFQAATARYVRISMGQRATQYGFSLYTLAVRSSADPATDLALHQTATASSTGDSWGAPSNAVDGDTTTRWESVYADNQWLEVDLGASKAFDRVEIAWENAYALNFTVQTSDDGATWADQIAVDNNAALGDTATQTESFASQTARYLRIQGGARATGYGISMWTLSAFDTSVSTTKDLAQGTTATASSDDGNPAPNAVDGNPRTRWSSAYQDDQWIQVDFGAATTFDQIAIAWEQAYARDYEIQVSTDASTWTTVKSVSNVITQLTISVNGVKVFCRGGNWGYDELLRRTDDGRLDTVVKMHRDMNFTMIRNWLGSSDREELYALADQYGILIWNDFWEAGAFNDDIPGYVDTVTETIRRYRTHPSIVVWCGANEENPPGHLDAGMRAAVAAEDGETIYIPNSAGGIVSGHGPYGWKDPSAYYDKSTFDTDAFGFHTEIGMPVVSVTETLQNMVGTEQGWPISEVWNYHDWSETANQQTGTYKTAIDTRLGESATLDQFSRRAQFVNYENHRAMFEAWNANLWKDASGLLLWMSHPTWYSTVWQTYDYDLDVNGAYYGSRIGCEPLHIQADPVNWRVVAVNHTRTSRTGVTLTATLYDLTGKKLDTPITQKVEIAASNTTTAFTVPTTPGAPALHLVRLAMTDSHGRLLSQNTYWRYTDASDMTALTSLPSTRLAISAGRQSRSGDSIETTVTVTNRGKTVAPMTRLSVLNRWNRRILPATYGDNYLWLLPGESRQVSVSWPADAGSARLSVDAYNASTVTC
ncbi:discoidin domain-containing protein [Frondihabitans australicus]|uniref:Glycosyl hydrolase family 2 n=1 Tax=Frondihabitans australicus TaxID=386892 RepID=A0A495II57_9MICO|nr:discoidin domain-containing protein [Frondihabitans australicus]RKR74795.1 glycosyl hydrolase family 2 [Frondihabitans australicus]